MIKAITKLCLLVFAIGMASCEMDEGKLPEIEFKTGEQYVSADTTLAKGTTFTVGIVARKTENRDVLKKFNISKSIDGQSSITLLNKDLNSDQEDYFSYNYSTSIDADSGSVVLYTYTISNRDGLINQLDLEVTVK